MSVVLPAPSGPDQPVGLPGLDAQADAVDRERRAEGPPQAVGQDQRLLL